MASLPDDVRPYALAKQFPRIANVLASSWHTPLECRHCFDDLLIDRRGNRKGFPSDVLADLLRLRKLHGDLYPTLDVAWQIPHPRR